MDTDWVQNHQCRLCESTKSCSKAWIAEKEIFRDADRPFDVFDRYRFRRHDIMDLVDMVDDNIKISNRKGSLTTTLQVLVALSFFACGSWSLVICLVCKSIVCRTIRSMLHSPD